MLYKYVRGKLPAINAEEFLIPLRNKRNIKPRIQTDFQTSNFVQRYSVNHTECFKIPDSQTNLKTPSLSGVTICQYRTVLYRTR